MDPLFGGDVVDTGTEPAEIREVLTLLFREPFFDGNQKPRQWQVLLENEAHIRSRMHDFYVELIINTGHRVAMRQQVHAEQEYRKLMPQRVMSRELAMAVLVVIDRFQRAAVANAPTATVTRREFAEAFDQMWGAGEKNRAARERNAEAALKRLYEANLIAGTSPANGGDSWTVSPAVPVIYGPDVLDSMTRALRRDEGDLDDAEIEEAE